MRFAGIIAEYDPFHNGHAWQLAQARALGARQVAVAMSCSLTQRGAVSLLPEAVRVQAALRCGADFIFALPAPAQAQGRRPLPGRVFGFWPLPGATPSFLGPRLRTPRS